VAEGGAGGDWPGQAGGGNVTLVDLGGGDYAACIDAGGSGSWFSPVGLYSVSTFPRGASLRVTFRWWGADGWANVKALMAPWHKSYPGSNMTETIEACITEQWNVMKWTETTWGSGTEMTDLNAAMDPWPDSKANSFLFRVWLGDVQGGKLEYSTDGGATWTTDSVANTIGTGSSNTVDVYLGFGNGNATEYVDDILVEDSEHLIPVELSEFTVE